MCSSRLAIHSKRVVPDLCQPAIRASSDHDDICLPWGAYSFPTDLSRIPSLTCIHEYPLRAEPTNAVDVLRPSNNEFAFSEYAGSGAHSPNLVLALANSLSVSEPL